MQPVQKVPYEDHVSIKTGLPPGIPIYIGKHEPEVTKVSALVYSAEGFTFFPEIQASDISQIRSGNDICWVHISGLKDNEMINQILSDAILHPLIAEDVFNTKGRAKVEDFGNAIFIILDIIISNGSELQSRKINIITKEKLLISISETSNPFENIKTRITLPNGKFRTHDIDYLMYSIIDSVVDTYFLVSKELRICQKNLKKGLFMIQIRTSSLKYNHFDIHSYNLRDRSGHFGMLLCTWNDLILIS